MLALAIALGAFGMWFNRRLRDQALEFWGSAAALVVRDAPQVELLALAPADPAAEGPTSDTGAAMAKATAGSADGETVAIGNRQLRVVARRDVSTVPGIIKLRLALLENRAFAWNQPRGDCPETWSYLLRFQGAESVDAALDLQCARLCYLQTGREKSIQPIATFVRRFAKDQFAKPQ